MQKCLLMECNMILPKIALNDLSRNNTFSMQKAPQKGSVHMWFHEGFTLLGNLNFKLYFWLNIPMGYSSLYIVLNLVYFINQET